MFPTAESLRRLVPQGVRGSVWDPETERERETHTHTQRERVGDWGGPETVWASNCMLPKGVPQGQTESGVIVLAAICWAREREREIERKESIRRASKWGVQSYEQ